MFDKKKQNFNKKAAAKEHNSNGVALNDESLLFATGGTASNDIGTCATCGTENVQLHGGRCGKCATQYGPVG